MDAETAERYTPLGATGDEDGLYVHFEPGFGLNVVIGFRWKNCWGVMTEFPDKRIRMGIDGFERLGELVDQWRAREAAGGKPTQQKGASDG